MARRSIAARFLDKTWKRASSSCWPWMGYIDAGGYPRFWVNKELGSVPAQRVSLLLFSEQEIELNAGDKVLTCPIMKDCVNPKHLAKAEGSDIGDRILWIKQQKRKAPYKPIGRVLNDDEIRQVYLAEGTLEEVAQQYGITPYRVDMIRKGVHYRKLTKDLENE